MEDKLLTRLQEILQGEYKQYQKLNELADSKTEQLTENNVEKLSELVEDEREIVEKVEDMEEERQQIVEDLSEFYDLEIEESNFSQLAQHLPETWQDKLGQVRSQLLTTIEDLQTKNEQNRALLEEAARLNEFTFNMYRKLLQPEDTTYDKPNSSKKQGNQNHIVDRRG